MKTSGICLADNGHISVAPTELVDESRFGNDGVFGAGAKAPTMAQLPSGLWVYGMTAADDTHIEIADSNSLDILDAITFELWMNPTSVSSLQRLMHKNGSYNIYIDSTNARVGTYNYGSASAFTADVSSISAGSWQHVTITKDSTNGVAFFVNGVAKGTNTTANAKTAYPVTVNSLYIGVDEDETTQVFGGQLALPHIYNYALNPAAVRARYNETVGWFR